MIAYLDSSNGRLAIDTVGGWVIVEHSRYYNDNLRPIVKVDVVEWRARYPEHELDGGDILDFGYWYLDTEDGELKYEPPVDDWRSEHRHLEKGDSYDE